MNKFLKKGKKIVVIVLLLIFLSSSALPFSIGFKNTVSAQGVGYTPRYPERLKYAVSEINQASKDLAYYSEKLKDLTEECDCSNAKSKIEREGTGDTKPGSPEAFGEACPNREEIEKTQLAIKNKIDEISRLRELLVKEKESGLEAELKTLRTDEALKLKINLNDLLGFIDESSTENIITSALNNVGFLNNDLYSVEKRGGANWGEGTIIELIACLLPGQQEPIKIIFNVGITLEKLDLGEIKIKLGINLPDKIKLADLANLKNIKIRLPNIDIPIGETPLNEPVVINPSSPEMPKLPSLKFSCPQLNPASSGEGSTGEVSPSHYVEIEWYSQTFSWLSEQCQAIPQAKNQFGIASVQCLYVESVHLYIVSTCNAVWQEYFECLRSEHPIDCEEPTAVCAFLGMSGTLKNHRAYQTECINLFQEEGETAPRDCYIDTVCSGPPGEEVCNATPESISLVLNTLEDKCSQIKEDAQSAGEEKEAPAPCKFLPLFTGEFKNPGSQTYQDPSTTIPAQTFYDNTGTGVRMDCPLSLFPTFPKIELPDIKIPDIDLPDFSFSPFFKVCLPDFIFEDLITPDLELCNLDNCKNLIPSINVKIPYPYLSIPTIEVPQISIPSDIGLKIKINKINLPSLPINIPPFNLSNLLNAEIELPEIKLPKPKIILEMEGVKINAFNLLLGYLLSFIPIPSGCISASLSFVPLTKCFPKYHFYWPKFPEIPDLCNNEYISVNKFCQDIKDSLDASGIKEKIDKIRDKMNEAIEPLQNKLNELAQIYNEVISEAIAKYIKEKAEIKTVLEEQRLKISGGEIPIPTEKINDLLSQIPTEINIPWPEDLKQINFGNPITMKLPSIPLDKLSYTKKVEINLPGFQIPSLTISLSSLGNYASFEGKAPSGGNPYPMDKIGDNLEKINDIVNNKISKASENINEILQ